MKILIAVLFCNVFLFSCHNPQKNPTNDYGKIKNESSKNNDTAAFEKINFLTRDSIRVYAHLYKVSGTSPVIVLCHQAGFNKYEYHEIALTLQSLGFNCLAIDQRSGGVMRASMPNETISHNRDKLSRFKGSRIDEFLSAQPDIEAAIDFASGRFNKKVILWGSSYSATHALYEGLFNDKVKAVVAFSPGNYFNDAKGEIEQLLSGFSKPLFVTSSKQESKKLTLMLSNLPEDEKHIQFIPKVKGRHGSKALWSENEGNEEYWVAVKRFLNNYCR